MMTLGRNGYKGIGSPKPLKHIKGFWSRDIDDKNRLIYKIENGEVIITQCGTHYGDK
ncbi:MAG: type II toxin-antitoxin system YoeB family toxin [Defluviitaleaceae bacterium]|nr:type II toxin-antitoxin system YoeB family toxin [Defluviitaleaceae bacterium]